MNYYKQPSHFYNYFDSPLLILKEDKNMRKFVVFAIFLLGISALYGCSSKPSEKAVVSNIENKYQNLVKVVNFKETNAQEGEFMGIKFYLMAYEAEIEYVEDVVLYKFGAVELMERKGKKMGREIKKGTRKKISGTLDFEKTKKGWQGEDGKVY